MTDLKNAIINMDIAEAFGLAAKVEDDGYAFYDKAITMTDNARAVEDLTFLRDQEKGHKTLFEKFLKDSGKEYKGNSDSPLYNWVNANLISPAQTALEKKSPQTYKEAISIGLKLEDNSILLYKTLAKEVESKETKKAIKQIIKEEQKHKKFLNAILRYS